MYNRVMYDGNWLMEKIEANVSLFILLFLILGLTTLGFLVNTSVIVLWVGPYISDTAHHLFQYFSFWIMLFGLGDLCEYKSKAQSRHTRTVPSKIPFHLDIP